MALYGANLSACLVDGTTYQQGTEICDIIRTALTEAQGVVGASYNPVKLTMDVLDAGSLAALKDTLQEEWARIAAVQELILAAPDTSQRLPSDLLEMLRGRVATASTALKIANDWYDLPSWSGISDGIVAIVGGIGATVGNALSKILGNFLAGIWPYLAGAAVVLYLVYFRRRTA
jgi:hypothetical protein